MKLIDKSLPELELDQAELSVERERTSGDKHAAQGRLAEINTICKERLPKSEYIALQQERGQLVQKIAQGEVKNTELKNRSRELHAVIEFKKRSALEVRGLISIRDEWHAFSLDDKNDRVKRQMAWKFSEQLTAYLKPYFEKQATPMIYV